MSIVRISAWVLSLQVVAWGSAVYGQGALDELEKKVDLAVDPPELPAPAAERMGYLGMSVDLTAPDGKSVFVKSVTPGGPAAKAGIRADDVVLAINNRDIRNLDDMDRAVRQPSGTKLQFKLRRDGVPQRIQVVLGERPGTTTPPMPTAELPAPKESAPTPDRNGVRSIAETPRPSLGIMVDDITDLAKRRFGVVVDSGAVITRIGKGTPAFDAGLPLGGVIVSVNGIKITSAKDIIEVVQAFRPGEKIDITYREGDRLGRKRVTVGSVEPEPAPPTPRAADSASETPRDPPLRLGARRSRRPILEALERTLDIVLPPARDRSRSSAERSTTPPMATAPPPPPLELDPPAAVPDPPEIERGTPAAAPDPPEVARGTPAADPTPPRKSPDELKELRRQMMELQQQLQRIQRRINELENKRSKDG